MPDRLAWLGVVAATLFALVKQIGAENTIIRIESAPPLLARISHTIGVDGV